MCVSSSVLLSADAVSCSRLGSVLLCWLIDKLPLILRADGVGLRNMSAQMYLLHVTQV